MNIIKKIFSSIYHLTIVLLFIAVLVFKAIDSWYGLAISERLYGKYLTNNFPIAVSIFITLAIVFYLARLDVERERKEKDIKNQSDKEQNS